MNSYNSTKPLNNPMQKMNKCIFINNKQSISTRKKISIIIHQGNAKMRSYLTLPGMTMILKEK